MGKGKKSDVQFILPELDEQMAQMEIVDEYLESPYTSILMSTASGDGLYTAMAKTRASFEVTAHDQNGERRPVGGDPFQVSVRGAAYVYAKVIDNGDGTYLVEYKPSTSGAYTIAITLHGVPMPGSPFALTVLAPRADASRCVLRGNTLKTIVARSASNFDVEFADAFGQIAHAEDLDVYVEPRPLPQNLPDGTELPSEGIVWAIVHPASRPLVVRSSIDLDSEKVGEILPGGMVGVLETNDMSDGTRRARVMFRPGSNRIGRAPGERSPERSPPHSRATTRTNTPINTFRDSNPGTPGRNSARSSAKGSGRDSARGYLSSRDPLSARNSARDSAPATPGRPTTPGRTPRSPGRSPRFTPSSSPRSPGRNTSSFSNPLDGGGSRPGTPGRSSGAPWVRVPSFARPLGEPSQTDRTRSRSPPGKDFFAPGALTAREAGEVGWVTAAKDGKETLVLRHLKLDASRRQQQMQLWSKQLAAEANRKAKENRTVRGRTEEEIRAARIGPSCEHELEADKSGIGFAYGGVEPGTLHAHGKLIKCHQVHYSVGRAGQYLLHVGIRNQVASLPGSPFELTVLPGAAHPVATTLALDEQTGRALPLRGVVGEPGSVTIFTSDRMGNRCHVGDAPLLVESKNKDLRTSQVDNQDGSYALEWLGEVSGKYELNVTIDGVNVTGSPTELTLLAAAPDVPKCEISGGGLSDAVAGEKVTVMVRCKDRFSNPTTPGTSMTFGLAVAPPAEKTEGEKKGKDKSKSNSSSAEDGEKKEKKDKSKDGDDSASSLPSKDFEGAWLAEGEYEIKYTAEKAGDYELHLWCDTEGNGVRQKLPGSPFPLHVVAAKASASGSIITGADQVRETPLTAGEHLVLDIHFRDDFMNACHPPARSSGQHKVQHGSSGMEEDAKLAGKGRRGSTVGAGSKGKIESAGTAAKQTEREEGVLAKLVTPSDEEFITDKLRPGDSVGTFGLSYELQLAGTYEAHFTLGGQQVTGSPVCFKVKPAQPSGRLSTLHPPADTPSVVGVLYELTLIAEDKYTNRLDRGGANVQARALGPSASPATTHDHGDGTYGVRFTAGAAGEYRVEVRLDNIKIKGSPHLINFTEPTAAQRKMLQASDAAKVTLGDEVDNEPMQQHDLRDASPERDSESGSPASSRRKSSVQLQGIPNLS